MKRMIAAALAIAVLLLAVVPLAGCGAKSELRRLSDRSGADLAHGEIVYKTDDHGGFLGDGMLYMVVHYGDGRAAQSIKNSVLWKTLPLPDNLDRFVYDHWFPDISVPRIMSGWYYFYDRHTESLNRNDPSDILERSSFNFDIAIYDADTDTLYYISIDT